MLGSIGVVLIAGGFVLVQLHGSWYYLLCGAALLACAVLIPWNQPAAARLYALLALCTLVWAFWEVGLDGWALLPRIIPLGILGLGFGPWSLPALRWAFMSAIPAAMVGWIAHSNLHPGLPDPLLRAGIATDAPLVADRSGTEPEEAVRSAGESSSAHYSGIGQVTPANVGGLRLEWTYRTGGLGAPLEVSPLKVGPMLYICTGTNDVIALDAETGVQRWRFRSGISGKDAIVKACRGVAYYADPSPGSTCPHRIYTNTIDARLIALDAATGNRCEGFGTHGEISLLTGMGDWRGRQLPGYYYVTSAPTVAGGRIILGGWVADAQYWGEPSGVVRAFDAVTGRFVWAFDMGRPDRNTEPAPGEQYTSSTPNAWAPMSADEELGLVYVPTGNTSGSDYYGGLRRPFDEKYSSSIVALDVRSGSVRWSFQTVHHDLWDYDVAAQPMLTEISRAEGVAHALVQATKTGEIFVLDRTNGVPLFPVEEAEAPAGLATAGERLAATQPVSIGLPSFSGPKLEERDMWGLTPIDQMLCRIAFKQSRYEGIYTPPGTAPFIQYPGILGGIEWSSVAVDPGRQLLIVNASRMANRVQLIPRAQADAQGRKPQGLGGHYLDRAQAGTPFAVANPFFVSSLGVPCQNPPFGTISAVDLRTGKLRWSRWLGTARGGGPLGLASHLPFPIGTPNLGGALTTRSGLTFVAAGQDRFLRAFASEDGRLLWERRLPAVSVATPVTYRSELSGRQFVVVAAGNADPRLGLMGDSIVAFALPP